MGSRNFNGTVKLDGVVASASANGDAAVATGRQPQPSVAQTLLDEVDQSDSRIKRRRLYMDEQLLKQQQQAEQVQHKSEEAAFDDGKLKDADHDVSKEAEAVSTDVTAGRATTTGGGGGGGGGGIGAGAGMVTAALPVVPTVESIGVIFDTGKNSSIPTSSSGSPTGQACITGCVGDMTPLRIVNPEHFDGAPNASSSPTNASPRALSRRHSTDFPGSEFDEEPSLNPFPVPMFSPRASPRPNAAHLLRIVSISDGNKTASVLCNSKVQKRTELHELAQSNNLDAFVAALDKASVEDIDACDEAGYSALMSVAAGKDASSAEAMSLALITKGADPNTCDHEGFTALHWAAAMGNCAAMKVLVDAGGSVGAQSSNGDTPLHRAARFGRSACITALIREHAADCATRNLQGHTPMNVAGRYCNHAMLVKRQCEAVRKTFYLADRKFKTLVLHHNDCFNHRTAKAHQEAPERCVMILQKVRGAIQPEFVHVSSNFPPATRKQLHYAHDPKYIEFVYDLHKTVARLGSPVPFTPRVQVMNGLDETKVKDETGCDTFFSEGSLPAALRAVGAVCNAVDRVVTGHNPNAFCIVRPPGHHAGVAGLLHDAISCGFCIFNNVAIAAKHALRMYPNRVRRVAIVDFDVHHGNGTEEIVRNKFKDPNGVFFFSIHLFDKPESTDTDTGEFYPGSGAKDVEEFNVVNAPLKPLWRLPTSSKMRSKAKRCPGGSVFSSSPSSSKGGQKNRDVNPTLGSDSDNCNKDCSIGTGSMNSSDDPNTSSSQLRSVPPQGCCSHNQLLSYGRAAFREHITRRLIPRLHAFAPDLVFISAGFDAGKNDIGCCKMEKGKYYSGIDLLPEDYFWVTKQIQGVADERCGGRIVSALEGGYGMWSRKKPSGPGLSRKLVLNREQLGENALAHCQALLI